MTSFLIAYINLQILSITLAFCTDSPIEFSDTSMCLHKVLGLKSDLCLRFPEMMIKGFVLQVLSLDQTAHPPGDPELQNAVSRPTPVISLGDPRASIHPPLTAIDLPFYLCQWSFLITATKALKKKKKTNMLYLELIVI